FAMVSDGASGAIVAWADRREGETNLDIYAGHVLSSGALDSRWPHHGVPLCIASGSQDLVAITVPAGPGGTGAIGTWQGPRPGSLGFDVYAQRILNSGVLGTGWPANGRAVCTSAGDQTQPTITSDTAFGVIVAWTDSRVPGATQIFAQHLLANSTFDPLWPVSGSAVSNGSPLEGHPLAVTDGEAGAIVTWQMTGTHVTMLAQRILFSGGRDPEWPPAGRVLGAPAQNQTSASIVPDGAGGAIVAWTGAFIAD